MKLYSIILYFNCFIMIVAIKNIKLLNMFQSLKSPNSIIISNTIYKTINYNVFTNFIKDQLMSPIIIKESIYIPIIALYVINEYLNWKYQNKNTKLESISNKRLLKLKRIINQVIFIINFAFIRDIESVS